MYAIVTVMEPFGTWLIKQLEQRNLSMSELGRRCGVSHATVSRVVSGERPPSDKLCKGIARVFNMTADSVFRLAGKLPPKIQSATNTDRHGYIQEVYDLMSELTPEDRYEILLYARMRYEHASNKIDAETSLLTDRNAT